MKHLSLTLNIVLLLAVGILYYLHFSSAKPNEKKKKNQITQLTKANGSAPLIGYVDLDTLNEPITFIKNTPSTKNLLHYFIAKVLIDLLDSNRKIGFQLYCSP